MEEKEIPLYVHYGHNHFEKEKFVPIINERSFTKPLGGLWASRIRDPELYTWSDWCQDEDFETHKFNQWFVFGIKDSANIYHINHKDDLKNLPEIDNIKESLYTENPYTQFHIDFERCIKQGIDAIELTNARSLYWVLYGWDCDSIIILNPDIIIELDSKENHLNDKKKP